MGDGKGAEERFNGGDRPLSCFYHHVAPVNEMRMKWRSLSEGTGGSKPGVLVQTWLPCVDRGTQPNVGFKGLQIMSNQHKDVYVYEQVASKLQRFLIRIRTVCTFSK